VRVAHVHKDVFPPIAAGIEVHMHSIRKALPDCAADVVACGRTRRTTIRSAYGGTEVKVAEFGRLLSMPIAPTFPLWVRRMSADVLHVHMPFPLGELAAARFDRRPLVVGYHADIVRQARLSSLYAPIQQACLKRASAIVVGTQRLADTSPALQPHRDKVHVVPYTVDADRFDTTRVPADAIAQVRERYGSPLVVAVGRLVYYKGFDTLIDAARELAGHVVIVGEGPLKVTLAQQAGGAAHVSLPGRLEEDELLALLAAANCFVMPSVNRAESFGIATLEAQAMGVPAVVTDVGTGTIEAIEPGRTGLVVAPADPRALAAAIRAILGDPERAREMGAAARDRVLARHVPSVQAAMLRPIYAAAMTHGTV
jgi:glycosyltransferase involved in cell wall biosynthesis